MTATNNPSQPQPSPEEPVVSLRERYFKRLGIRPGQLDNNPTLSNLKVLVEAHLNTIPFDNLAQHGAVGGPAVLDVSTTATKLLDRGRGGFCLELNGLFSVLLQELGYSVLRVPGHVYTADGFFRDEPTHLFCIVGVPVDAHGDDGGQDNAHGQERRYFVDVGFGESPLEPLLYEMDTPFVTKEGMESRFVEEPTDETVILQWQKEGSWAPRLKWDRRHAELAFADSPALTDFAPLLSNVQQEDSNFSRKLVVCIISKDRKTTLAGNRLKLTTPRFGPERTVTVHEIDDIQGLLETKFGMPLSETEGLDLDKSTKAPKEVWSTF